MYLGGLDMEEPEGVFKSFAFDLKPMQDLICINCIKMEGPQTRVLALHVLR